MHAYEPVGALGERGERGDGDGGRVAGDDDAVAKKMVGFGEHVALELELFGHGLHDKIGVRDGRHVRDRKQPCQHSPLLRFRQLAFLDFAVEIFRDGIDGAVEKTLLDIAQQHLVARARKHVRNTVTHGARAEHGHGFDGIDGHGGLRKQSKVYS